jgi:septin family protein
MVARAAGFSRTELKSFRDNISRRIMKDRLALISYQGFLEEMEAMSRKEIEQALRLWSCSVT